MSKSLLSLFVAVLFVLGFTAGIANAGIVVDEGIFESPFVTNAGSQVDDSEGKIDEDGDWKVESYDLGDTECYDICLCDENGGQVVLVANVCTDEDGELKAIGTLSSGNYQAVSFKIIQAIDTCGSEPTIVQESGLTVPNS